MRRRRLAAMMGCAVAMAAPGSPWAEETDRTTEILTFNLSAAGVGAADIRITAVFERGWYYINAAGRTYGAADIFESLAVNATVQGKVAADLVQPQTFGTDNILDGDRRSTRVTWSGAEAVAQSVVPSLAEEERTPIPDEARQGALDPISAMLRFALGAPSQGRCEGYSPVFDGRRSYTLVLDAQDGNGVAETIAIGDARVETLRCRITSIRTGGKSPDSWLTSSDPYEHALIWFWKDPKGRALPVRVKADAPVGSAIAELAALP